MIVLDANILLYSQNADAPQHAAVRTWLEQTLNGQEWVGLPWITCWAFLRISTHPRLFPSPLPMADAMSVIQQLAAQPRVRMIAPGPQHIRLLEQLALKYQITGPLVTDAALAAVCLEHGATLASTDRGFARFEDLRWVNPLS